VSGRTAAGALAAAGLLAACGGTLAACFDLFHGTRDVLTGCELDAEAAGCRLEPTPVEAGPDAGPPADPCTSPTEAKLRARHACAWLGACGADGGEGRKPFGACVFDGLLAYDCAANPNHRAKGAEAAFWHCLSDVGSCSAVAACIALLGPAPAASCMRSECDGTQLHWCLDGGDVGIDCNGNGAQSCAGLPTMDNARWLACVAESDAGRCEASTAARCDDGGAAWSCPSGLVETIDCQALLGAANACAAGALQNSFDWTSPCAVQPPQCTSESCEDGGLVGCMRGVRVTDDCAAEKLGACRTVPADAGAAQRAICGLP
jgi:hypothetical protein